MIKNKEKFSVIIPTMQKDTGILNKLLEELYEDDTIGEIILIDNSLKDYNSDSDKLRVIVPEKNLFVNPSWNYGVSLAKYDYVGILNDDLIIPKNFCKQVLNFLKENENCGMLGLESSTLMQSENEDFSSYPEDSEISCKEIQNIWMDKNWYWGSAIFCKKENYEKIPEEMLVYCGDDYLIFKNKKCGRKNFVISNAKVKHYGALTSRSKFIRKIRARDQKFYCKIDEEFLLRKKIDQADNEPYDNFLERILSLKDTKNKKHRILTILGLKFKFRLKY